MKRGAFGVRFSVFAVVGLIAGACTPPPGGGGTTTTTEPPEVSDLPRTFDTQGDHSAFVAAGDAFAYEIAGGGGGSGAWGSQRGGSGTKLTGTIPAQATSYTLTVNVGGGGPGGSDAAGGDGGARGVLVCARRALWKPAGDQGQGLRWWWWHHRYSQHRQRDTGGHSRWGRIRWWRL